MRHETGDPQPDPRHSFSITASRSVRMQTEKGRSIRRPADRTCIRRYIRHLQRV
jgi:hypothetical protein